MPDTLSKFKKIWFICAIVVAIGTCVSIRTNDASAIAGGWAAPNLTHVSVAAEHACAIANGKIYCWGRNDVGQMGNGTYTNSPVPTPVTMTGAMAGKTATAVSAGVDYSCAIVGGEVYCWGHNANGKLGTGNTTASNVPVKTINTSGALLNETVVSVSAGGNHTCAVTQSNKIACWGLNTSGQLGRGNTTSPATTPVLTNMTGVLSGRTVQKVAAGGSHTCARASGLAYCWGAGANGRLGNGGTGNQTNPVAVSTSTGLSGKTITDIVASPNAHSCAVASGQAYCWGLNSTSQLGNGGTTQATSPVVVNTSGALSGKTVTSMGLGYSYSCAVLSDGGASCWGWNGGGTNNEIGYMGNGGSASTYSTPTTVDRSGEASGKNFTQINGGSYHTCGLASGRIFCWGSNAYGGATDYGMLGANNQFASALRPVQTRWSAGMEQTAFRFYAASSSSSLPGAPVAPVNSPVLLLTDKIPLRLRMGVQSMANQGVPVDFFANTVNMRLQYAAKTAATCTSQTTGFADVTGSTPISLHPYSGTTHGAASSFYPEHDPFGRPIQSMPFVSMPGLVNNPWTVLAENMGIWDFSLIDNGAPLSTRYCLRLNHGGSPLESYPVMAEIRTADPISLSLSFVDGSLNTVANPTMSLPPALIQSTCQTSTGWLATENSLRIRVNQMGAKASWALSVAPTNGPTALWTRSDGQAFYDFNDSSGSPAGCGSGSDGDSYAGRMSVDLTNLTYQPQTPECTGGVFLGYSGAASFTESVQALSIVSVAANAGSACYRDIYGIGVSQTIPAYQPHGQYSLDMTFTAVAQ